MQRPLLFMALIGIAIIVGVSVAGYYLGKLVEDRGRGEPTPSPEASPAPEETPLPSPSPSSPAAPSPSSGPKALPTAPAARPTPAVKGGRATPRPTPEVWPETSTPSPSSEWETKSLSLTFVNLPRTVRSGEAFTVTWKIDGPHGTTGSSAKLSASYDTASSSGGSSASSSSSSEQSFGAFTVPKEFSTHLTYGGSPGTIHLRVTAEAGGTTLKKEASIALVN